MRMTRLLKSISLKFKYNTLYRFNFNLIKKVIEKSEFKYNTLYRFNFNLIKKVIKKSEFKYNTLYRFNGRIEKILRFFNFYLNTTLCIGSIFTVQTFFNCSLYLNTTLCIGSIFHIEISLFFITQFKYNTLYRFNTYTTQVLYQQYLI